jgi:hypothetical protein
MGELRAARCGLHGVASWGWSSLVYKNSSVVVAGKTQIRELKLRMIESFLWLQRQEI